ncbi:hypothetical protein MJO28_001530 [Puccinia striiformis f. sp. tritici]|uniref:Uncharacterized protein n=1 Tax=Puccinia striiformis f. sp. tritici TaxID=168172 RepID=A0ACC0EVC9_9BASI|nr:hypothetical protein MJO28_001530 [Puccinia striiformis f. sp. tritici]
MNIPLWKKGLEDANLLPEFDDVIHGFTHGFPQGVPCHTITGLKWYTPPNHSSAIKAKEKIRETIKKELAAERMFGPFTHDEVATVFPFFRSSPLGAVVNGDGSVRAINNLSFPHNDPSIKSVNSFVDSGDFMTTWDDFQVVSRFLRNQREEVELALFDWEKAYRQIPTAMDQWPYMFVLDFNGMLLLDTRITFGGVAGCGSFGRPADAWKRMMLSEFDLITIFRWVDDNLFIRKKGSTTCMDNVAERAAHLGVLTNKTKYRAFAEEQKFIGFVWNGKHKTVRLPPGKLEQRIDQISVFLVLGRKYSYDDLEILVGRLNHVSYIVPQLKCYLFGLYRMLCNWSNKAATRFLDTDANDDLNMWHKTLCSFRPLRMIPNPVPVDVGWYGDASTSFGVGVVIGKGWAQFKLVGDWVGPIHSPRGIAWLETVAVRLGILMLIELGAVKGKQFIVRTDNTTTEGVIRNRKSSDRHVNSEWKLIQSILIGEEINILGQRVSSGENVSDDLSRGVTTGRRLLDKLSIQLPTDLKGRFIQI